MADSLLSKHSGSTRQSANNCSEAERPEPQLRQQPFSYDAAVWPTTLQEDISEVSLQSSEDQPTAISDQNHPNDANYFPTDQHNFIKAGGLLRFMNSNAEGCHLEEQQLMSDILLHTPSDQQSSQDTCSNGTAYTLPTQCTDVTTDGGIDMSFFEDIMEQSFPFASSTSTEGGNNCMVMDTLGIDKSDLSAVACTSHVPNLADDATLNTIVDQPPLHYKRHR